MLRIYNIPEKEEVSEILHEGHEIFDLLRENPELGKLLGEKELYQLHLLLILLRMGYLSTKWIHTLENRLILLEVKD